MQQMSCNEQEWQAKMDAEARRTEELKQAHQRAMQVADQVQTPAQHNVPWRCSFPPFIGFTLPNCLLPCWGHGDGMLSASCVPISLANRDFTTLHHRQAWNVSI